MENLEENDDEISLCVYEDGGGNLTLVVGEPHKRPQYIHSNFEGFEGMLCDCIHQLIKENTVDEWENNEVDAMPTHKGHGTMIFGIGIDYKRVEFSINVYHRNAGASGRRFLKEFFKRNIFDE